MFLGCLWGLGRVWDFGSETSIFWVWGLRRATQTLGGSSSTPSVLLKASEHLERRKNWGSKSALVVSARRLDMSAEVRRHRPDVSVHIYIHVSTHTYTHIRICVHTYIYIYTHMLPLILELTHTHMYIDTHTHT